MNIFIIDVSYITSIENVELHLSGHRDFLNNFIKKNVILLAGRKTPRTGGIIIAKGQHRQEIELMMNQDPFVINSVAEIKITEFEPTLFNNQMNNIFKENE